MEPPAFLSVALALGEGSDAAFSEPVSESIEPFSFGPDSLIPVRRTGLGNEDEPNEIVQATMSNSRRMWATASSSVYFSAAI